MGESKSVYGLEISENIIGASRLLQFGDYFKQTAIARDMLAKQQADIDAWNAQQAQREAEQAIQDSNPWARGRPEPLVINKPEPEVEKPEPPPTPVVEVEPEPTVQVYPLPEEEPLPEPEELPPEPTVQTFPLPEEEPLPDPVPIPPDLPPEEVELDLPDVQLDIDCAPLGPAEDVEIYEFSQVDSVTKVQDFLIGLGYPEVGDSNNMSDGMFGRGTGRAVSDFLRNVQGSAEPPLEQTGEYDEATQEALQKLIDSTENEDLKGALEDFKEGMDELHNEQITDDNGLTASALDRIYEPSDYDNSPCTIGPSEIQPNLGSGPGLH
jgi:hypothetical protein